MWGTKQSSHVGTVHKTEVEDAGKDTVFVPTIDAADFLRRALVVNNEAAAKSERDVLLSEVLQLARVLAIPIDLFL